MDKLITAIIIAAVAFLFYWLYSMGGPAEEAAMPEPGTSEMEPAAEPAPAGPWVGVVGIGEEAHVSGHYNSYAECYRDVANKVDVNVTPYSCTNQ